MGATSNRQCIDRGPRIDSQAERNQMFETKNLFPPKADIPASRPQFQTANTSSAVSQLAVARTMKSFRDRYFEFLRVPNICNWKFNNKLELIFLKCFIYEEIMLILKDRDPLSYISKVFFQQQKLLKDLLNMIMKHKNTMEIDLDTLELLLEPTCKHVMNTLQELYDRETPLSYTQAISNLDLQDIGKYIYGFYLKQNSTSGSVQESQYYLVVLCFILYIICPFETSFLSNIENEPLSNLEDKLKDFSPSEQL